MDISFLKMRAASASWLVVTPPPQDSGYDPFSEYRFRGSPGNAGSYPGELCSIAAKTLCDRHSGAGADGILFLSLKDGSTVMDTWSSSGRKVDAPPAALLCAGRYLFDAGKVEDGAIRIGSGTSQAEIIPIDSKVFGISSGAPKCGRILRDGPRFSDDRLARNHIGGTGVALGNLQARVEFWDGEAPRRRRQRFGRNGPLVVAGIVARGILDVRPAGIDGATACACALAAAHAAELCDSEARCSIGRDTVLAHLSHGQPGDVADGRREPTGEGPRFEVFVASAVTYCFRGEWWHGDKEA